MDAAGIEEHTAAEPKYMSRRKYEQHKSRRPQVHGCSASFCWKRKTAKEKSSALKTCTLLRRNTKNTVKWG
jgi:hypothetical protein